MEIEIPAGEVRVGDVVVIHAGERVPVDGPVLIGRSSIDQSALTGEPIPVDKGPGEHVFTGTLNQFGVIEVRAEKVGHETTFGQVLKLVADAQRRKSPLERTADKLARYFLPVVEIVAGLTVVAGLWFGWPDVWFRAVAVLVVACPCALVLATPAAVLASMAWLARHGILIKGGAALEAPRGLRRNRVRQDRHVDARPSGNRRNRAVGRPLFSSDSPPRRDGGRIEFAPAEPGRGA